MKCVATEMGYTKNGRVREGAIFEMPDGATGTWFHPVGEQKPAAREAVGRQASRPVATVRPPTRKPRTTRAQRAGRRAAASAQSAARAEAAYPMEDGEQAE